MPKVTVSHIGICTADAGRSIRFYTQALGFVHERFIELIGYPNSDVTGSAERRPMNQLGFTHMTLVVDDVGATADRVVEFGGQVHLETMIDSPYGPIVFCTDPDGVRVELMRAGA
jgi:predicted enzyme related to lactoylglutathione lyase